VEHQEAIDTQAAEAYLLGDLTAAEHEAFEEHFFDCDTCFADVRDGATVVAAVRADIPVEKPVRRGLRDVFPKLAVAASIAVAVGVIGYQQVELARLRAPRITEIHALSDMRAEQVETVIDPRAPFILDFDIPPEPPSPQGYTCAIVDAQGKVHYRMFVTAERARRSIPWEMPAGLLPPGHYSLVVTGADQTPRFKSEFAVMQKERMP
jgi:Putative zinc-finger